MQYKLPQSKLTNVNVYSKCCFAGKRSSEEINMS